jgi:hypothetical protein
VLECGLVGKVLTQRHESPGVRRELHRQQCQKEAETRHIPKSQKAMATFQSTVSEKARRRWRNMGHENEGEPGIGSMSFSALDEGERRFRVEEC